MNKYSSEIIDNAKLLRSMGKTYAEISSILKIKIPKSTFATWCKGIILPQEYSNRILKINLENLGLARQIALSSNKEKREKYISSLKKQVINVANEIDKPEVSLIALAMLYLGEGAKYASKGQSCSLGNSNPKIIRLYLNLLSKTDNFNPKKLRATVQCRADQNVNNLERYWQKVTNIPKEQFYKTRIDSRTTGKPTLKSEYKGVLRVDYFSTETQLKIEFLGEFIYNKLLDTDNGPKV